MAWIDVWHILQAFVFRQVARPLWHFMSVGLIIIVIGNAAMGKIRQRIREPARALWRSYWVLVCIGVGAASFLPIMYLGWQQALAAVIFASSVLRRPVFWLGDHVFDYWTKPVRYHLRRAIHRSRGLRAVLRYPRSALAVAYSAFETARERRQGKRHPSPVE